MNSEALVLTRAEEIAWRDKAHEMQLAALEMRRATNAEVRAYREYLTIRYGVVQEKRIDGTEENA